MGGRKLWLRKISRKAFLENMSLYCHLNQPCSFPHQFAIHFFLSFLLLRVFLFVFVFSFFDRNVSWRRNWSTASNCFIFCYRDAVEYMLLVFVFYIFCLFQRLFLASWHRNGLVKCASIKTKAISLLFLK